MERLYPVTTIETTETMSMKETPEYVVISKDELRDLRRDRDWADFFCELFLKAEHRGDLEMMTRHIHPLCRYARIRGIEIPWKK